MDAKMSEIRDYVYANNLERFDTERNSYYQKLISEYNSLYKTYHRLDYNVLKLDENNIQISELIGKEYESVRFKTGSQIGERFDNYVTPEDDYAEYRAQLVKQDASGYADEIRNKISQIDSDSAPVTMIAKASEGDGKPFDELNPKKDSVFKEVSVNDLAGNFKRKIVDNKEFKELRNCHEVKVVL